ncbi:hypothetical protein RIB2604_01902240 [Aspergillus luchuensis]|uniref:Uncharacterized protein n=1 Tax=Aspergillus kawachii TaxID=1069201 RepID=A0A146FGY2_ASPKA|nr:hypothetical protein RIB2604_01902240 [Aspergillus luchuensis]
MKIDTACANFRMVKHFPKGQPITTRGWKASYALA